MQTLADLDEDRLVAALLACLPDSVRHGEGVVAGAGDDCAAVDPPDEQGSLQLLKTDCIIEGIHYATGTAPEKVGWKALCRPLSDIAAMGGRPLCALVTLALPASTPLTYARGIYVGLGRAAECFHVRIIGGETARSPSATFISVTVTGLVSRERLVSRSGGRVGDAIYVTGCLGGSFESGRHLDFVPRLEEAQWLGWHFPPSAMMDLSDGLGRDLPRLADASATGYRVQAQALPLAPGCTAAQALGDGEDYELLFTVAPTVCAPLELAWPGQWPNLQLTRIGELAAPSCQSGLHPHSGFDHFAHRAATRIEP